MLDGIFEIDKPEALVYHPIGNGNKKRLVAIEYLMSIDFFPDSPPKGYTGDHDQWSRNDEKGVWTLHVWLWIHNPDGMFAEVNPDLLP
ncbi:MAG: hypothetical protein EH225_07080 [Calditrichaeota bacterium]|nr:MAG: hypothetical protein EH225_07080 [Calditrichota bacterium]